MFFRILFINKILTCCWSEFQFVLYHLLLFKQKVDYIYIYLSIYFHFLNASAHQWTHKLKSIVRHMKEHGVEKQTLTDDFSDLKN